MKKSDAAWLAGFWDGEGSVGLTRNKTTFILNAQLSHTDKSSVVHVLSLLREAGINGRGYTYQEKDPSKHRDAHHIRVSGMGNILKFAKAMLPHSVTKKRHWEIAIEWAERRIVVAGGVDAKGRLFRGNDTRKRKYVAIDHLRFAELKALNARGPSSNDGKLRGRI